MTIETKTLSSNSKYSAKVISVVNGLLVRIEEDGLLEANPSNKIEEDVKVYQDESILKTDIERLIKHGYIFAVLPFYGVTGGLVCDIHY